MSELPQPQPGKEWQAAPEQYDELAKMREQKLTEQEANSQAKRDYLQQLADEKYPVAEQASHTESQEAVDQDKAA